MCLEGRQHLLALSYCMIFPSGMDVYRVGWEEGERLCHALGRSGGAGMIHILTWHLHI